MIFTDTRLLDFRNFLFIVWQALGLPAPTRVQYDMAHALQGAVKSAFGIPYDKAEYQLMFPSLWDAANDRPSRRIVLQAFRGVGKSWITSVLVMWVLALLPHLNIMVNSAGKARADAFSTFAKRLMHEVATLKPLLPHPDKGQRYSNVAFDVGPAPAAHAPSVLSLGIMGQLTGGRADLIVADDVEVPNNSETQTMREKLEARTTEYSAIIKPGGLVVYLGTPQCEDSLYCAVESRGYSRIVWPSRYPSAAWMKAHGYCLPKLIQDDLDAKGSESLCTGCGLAGDLGAPTDPERFGDADLCEREAEYGRSGFALQFQLDTTLADADRYPLKLSDALVMDMNQELAPEQIIWANTPELIEKNLPCVGFRGDRWLRPWQIKGDMIAYQGSVMAIDPAGRGNDELAYAIVKQLNGYLYVAECRGYTGGYTKENLTRLANRAKHHAVNLVISEPNFGGGMFNELLKPIFRDIYPVTIEDAEWSSTQKERRIIETLEPVLNQHRLIFDRRVVTDDGIAHDGESTERGRVRQLFFQMTRCTFERQCLKHDDRLDALAMAVGYWKKAMAQSAKVKTMEREVEKYMERMEEIRDGGRVRVNRRDDALSPSFLGPLN